MIAADFDQFLELAAELHKLNQRRAEITKALADLGVAVTPPLPDCIRGEPETGHGKINIDWVPFGDTPPAGYKLIPEPRVHCRCVNLWRASTGEYYCCGGQ